MHNNKSDILHNVFMSQFYHKLSIDPFSRVPLAMNGRSVLHSNKQSRRRLGIRDSFWCFSRIMCIQSIRTVGNISRDGRESIATCSLLTSPDRLKKNYLCVSPCFCSGSTFHVHVAVENIGPTRS